MAAVALGMAVPVAMLLRAAATGAGGSLPIDDAWIHLTYARTLAAGGGFRYFPGDATTTGSTAPLFTLLEALGFLVTRNEIAIAVTLGLAAHLVFLLALARWAGRRLGHAGWTAFVVALVAADGRFGILAASGMETSLFLAGLAVAFAAWAADDALAAGLALGAATWVRPEALVLAGVFAIDAALARQLPRRVLAGLGACVALVAAYLAFNRLTGGALLPLSLAAKAAYYGDRPLARFLSDDVAATFGGGWLLLAPFAALGA
jgi:Gpi18-like mannosyltransferase